MEGGGLKMSQPHVVMSYYIQIYINIFQSSRLQYQGQTYTRKDTIAKVCLLSLGISYVLTKFN